MTPILLTVQFVVAAAMIVTILLQRSEGGALGLGGGGGVSSLMSGRGAANALSRMTVFLAAIFIATSLALAMVAKANSHGGSVLVPATNTGPGGVRTIPLMPGTPPAAAGSRPASPLVPAVPVPAPATPGPAAPSTAPAGAHPAAGSTPPPAAPASGGGH